DDSVSAKILALSLKVNVEFHRALAQRPGSDAETSAAKCDSFFFESGGQAVEAGFQLRRGWRAQRLPPKFVGSGYAALHEGQEFVTIVGFFHHAFDAQVVSFAQREIAETTDEDDRRLLRA